MEAVQVVKQGIKCYSYVITQDTSVDANIVVLTFRSVHVSVLH